jgi:hypothetical protein
MSERVLDLAGRLGAAPADQLAAALLDRISLREQLIAALEADQTRDLATFSDRRVEADGWSTPRSPSWPAPGP